MKQLRSHSKILYDLMSNLSVSSTVTSNSSMVIKTDVSLPNEQKEAGKKEADNMPGKCNLTPLKVIWAGACKEQVEDVKVQQIALEESRARKQLMLWLLRLWMPVQSMFRR